VKLVDAWGRLEAGQLVPFEVLLHMLFHCHGVLEESVFSESEGAWYPPTLLLRRGRSEGGCSRRFSFCDCDGRIVGLTGCGYEIRSFSHDIERGVEEFELEVIQLVEL
jgi:hypothetical protein